MTFEAFPKIPRLNRGMVVTEKIDGTNAQVEIDRLETAPFDGPFVALVEQPDGDMWTVRAGSRKRYITPDDDNFGFASWVKEHASELTKLGLGRHYGEWWGHGIQRGYGLTEKRFSLFNTSRWLTSDDERVPGLPDCVGVVPVLYRGAYSSAAISALVEALRIKGSVAAFGWKPAEGVVVWHEAARQMFKVLVENDDVSKGQVAA